MTVTNIEAIAETAPTRKRINLPVWNDAPSACPRQESCVTYLETRGMVMTDGHESEEYALAGVQLRDCAMGRAYDHARCTKFASVNTYNERVA